MSQVQKVVSVATDEAGDTISDTPTNMRFIHWKNTTAANAEAYIQFFHVVIGSVMVGTTTPDFWIPLNADNANDAGTGSITFPGEGIPMRGTGFSIAVTTTATGSGAADAEVTIGIGN